MHYKTLYEAQFSARYGARYNERAANSWRKLSTLISMIELLGGSTAFAAYLSDNTQLAAYTALVVAVCVVLNHTLHPVEKAKDGEMLFIRFMQLAGNQSITLKKYNKKLSELCAIPDNGFDILKEVSYNDIAKELGRDEYVKKLTLWQTVVTKII